ncbi:MAG: DUF4350 domain-containing protein [Mucilaginibacter sp.]|uniref:DUF4350 domain-containing protein n=1 Tax=Mucilaginibacter sp. TaxID=1882438 RepID=UPI0032666607
MKSLKIYIGILSALLIIYIVAKYNEPKALNWSQTLSNTDKIPFGTYILYQRINDIFPKAKVTAYREPIYNVVNDHGIKHGTYIIICDNIDLSKYDYEKLRGYIKAGNDVFIAASYFGDELGKQLKINTRSEFGDSTAVKFTNNYIDTNKVFSAKKGMSDGYFGSIDTAKATLLGTNQKHHANYVKYNIGKGNLFLNTMPLMFSNYSLLDKSGVTYASTALSYVKKDNNLMWDQYYTLGREDDSSSMRVFLRNPALKWAFYIAFFSFTAFILFEIKRRQRIIPIIEPLRNSTIDFVNVVGQVYYEQRDNSDIAHKKASYFLEHLRTQYGLKTNILNDEFVTQLTHKSGVDRVLIRELMNQITLARSGTIVSDTELINLNKNIEQFNIQSR